MQQRVPHSAPGGVLEIFKRYEQSGRADLKAMNLRPEIWSFVSKKTVFWFVSKTVLDIEGRDDTDAGRGRLGYQLNFPTRRCLQQRQENSVFYVVLRQVAWMQDVDPQCRHVAHPSFVTGESDLLALARAGTARASKTESSCVSRVKS